MRMQAAVGRAGTTREWSMRREEVLLGALVFSTGGGCLDASSSEGQVTAVTTIAPPFLYLARER